jgi:hypothetical protein
MFRVVFWDILPCKMIVDRHFRGAYCLHHQGWWWRQHVTLKPTIYNVSVKHMLVIKSTSVKGVWCQFMALSITSCRTQLTLWRGTEESLTVQEVQPVYLNCLLRLALLNPSPGSFLCLCSSSCLLQHGCCLTARTGQLATKLFGWTCPALTCINTKHV